MYTFSTLTYDCYCAILYLYVDYLQSCSFYVAVTGVLYNGAVSCATKYIAAFIAHY